MTTSILTSLKGEKHFSQEIPCKKNSFELLPAPLPISSPPISSSLVFSILNSPQEKLHLDTSQGLIEKGHLVAWVKKEKVLPGETLLEKVSVRGFRGVEGEELLDKILLLGATKLVAIRTSQEVVLLPRLEASGLTDDNLTEDFIRRFNENIFEKEYRTKALEFVLQLREMGGLEDKPFTTLSKVRIGFVRLAKCKDEGVIEAAMLSLYEFEQKSRAGLLKQEGQARPTSGRSGRPSSARSSATKGEFSLGASTAGITGEGLVQAFLELLEVLDSEYFITLTPSTQCVILKAYTCLLESMIAYSGQEGQVPLVSRMEESRRKTIISQLKKVEGLTWTESQPEATYLVRLALEGSKRLADDVAAWEKGARRMVRFCSALKDAYNKDLAGAIENLAVIFKDVEILRDWYELLYAIREMGKAASQDRKHFSKFMQLINDRKVKQGAWEVQYTAVSSLGEIIHNSQDARIRQYALKGYDPEGKGVFFQGLWAFACLKDGKDPAANGTVFNKAMTFLKGSSGEAVEKSRIRYKAAEVLKSLQHHKDSSIGEEVQFYLSERENSETLIHIKALLATPFIHLEKRVQELLGIKKETPLNFLQDTPSRVNSPSQKKLSDVAHQPSEALPSYQEVISSQVKSSPPTSQVLTVVSKPTPQASATTIPAPQEAPLEVKEISPPISPPKSPTPPPEVPTLSNTSEAKRIALTVENLALPAAEHNELIRKKLQNPQQDLSLEESIALLTQCIQYGKVEAEKARDKDAVIFIGNTGAGKSTTVNYLCGCTMELKSPEELGMKGLDDIVVVQPPSAGGSRAEVMPIGHTRESKTFMPQIETDTTQNITYCDCPGFLDNRGAEINIANAVNIKNAIAQAKSVTVIILINYHSLKADRARGLTEMLKIACNLFGKADNLLGNKESVLIGVSNLPLNMRLQRLKEWIAEDATPLMKTLAERIFIFDPLDRPLNGGLVREELLTRIKSLKPITNQTKIFSTVLTDEDENRLLRISEEIGQKIQEALRSKNFKQASSHFHRLQELRLIDHVTIERLLSSNYQRIERQLQEEKNAIMTHCHFERFSIAEKQLQDLEEALKYFDEDLTDSLNISTLQAYYRDSKQKAEASSRKEEEYKKQLEAAHKQIQEFISLLEQQKRNTEEQLRQQQQNFTQAMQEMENTIKRTATEYDQMKKELQQEMQARLTQKEEELQTAQGQNLQEVQQRLEQERAKLNSEYAQKLQEMELERKRVADEQQVLKQKAAQGLEAEKARLQQKIQELETSKQQKLLEQKQQEEEQARLEQARQEKARVEELAQQNAQETNIPPQAFGKKEWEKYFGDVGAEPKLPSNINQILQSPCPIWPDKKVADTHLLTLIPQSVNGEPLTLSYLWKLVQSPKGGGNSSKYSYYDNDVKNAIGTKSLDRSYWVLLTKDVLPNTMNKDYECRELANWKKKSPAFQAGGYRVPKALEVTTSVFMEHARSGTRFYSDDKGANRQCTYTRCLETSTQGYQVLIGGFAASGLYVYGDDYDRANAVNGLGATREV